MEQQRRFFLLHERLPSSEIPKMLCRVVTNKYLPLENYAPKEPLTATTTTVPENTNTNTSPQKPNETSIIPPVEQLLPLPPPSKTLSSTDFIRNVSDTGLKASLAVLFGLETSFSHDQSVMLQSKEVNRYVLSNPAQYFSQLMRENPFYASDVKDLLASPPPTGDGHGNGLLGTIKHRGYLVTGFLTARQTKWTFESTCSKGVELSVSAPVVEALTGVPVMPVAGLDPEVGTSITRARERKREVYVEEEEIFAVAYSVVELKRKSLFGRGTGGNEKDEEEKGGGSQRTKSTSNTNKVPVLTGPVRVKRRHMVYSGEDGSDEDEVDEEDDEHEQEGEDELEIEIVHQGEVPLDDAEAGIYF